MQVIAIKDGKGDVVVSREAALEVMRDHPDLRGVFVTEAVAASGSAKRFAARTDRTS